MDFHAVPVTLVALTYTEKVDKVPRFRCQEFDGVKPITWAQDIYS
jgi:hypothetical protein